ncbi:MAG: nuclear transport factor 2 family protein [Halomonadaceae bacterium]|nr:MAG: nuclear transport factor 2 family protein [Halomonadaceae bacterium]
MSDVINGLEAFKTLFNQLGPEYTDGLDQVYAPGVSFRDPFVEIQGLDALETYFTGAYSNVIACQFDYGQPLINGDRVALPWVMHLQHRKLRSGQELIVDGMSHLHLHKHLVIYHRDYFDAGQLLYENVPLLGSAVRWLRRHAA